MRIAFPRIAVFFSFTAMLLLTGCKKEPSPFDGRPAEYEKWIYHGTLYVIVYYSGGTYMKVYNNQDGGYTPVIDQKLAFDIQTAANNTKVERANANAGNSTVQSAQARAATGSFTTVNVFILDFANQLEKFDPVTKTLTATLDLFGAGLPGQPVGMDVTADSKFAVVTETADTPNVPYVLLIDLTTFKIASKINLPSGTFPVRVSITPDGLFAYIASTPFREGDDSTVYVIDIAARSVATSITIPANRNLDEIVMTPDGVSAYLASDFSFNSSIPVIDIATNTLALSASTQGSIPPLQMAMHPDGTRLYLVPTDGSTIKILSTATHTISGTIPGPGQGGLLPVGKVAVGSTPPVFTPDGRFLFILGTPQTISMIDTSTDTQVATIPGPAMNTNPGRPKFTYFVVP